MVYRFVYQQNNEWYGMESNGMSGNETQGQATAALNTSICKSVRKREEERAGKKKECEESLARRPCGAISVSKS